MFSKPPSVIFDCNTFLQALVKPNGAAGACVALLERDQAEYHFERDPKDEAYLNLAIVANATYLVSKDNDLLDLMMTQRPEAWNFRLRYPMLKILTAPAFLQEMRQRHLSLSE